MSHVDRGAGCSGTLSVSPVLIIVLGSGSSCDCAVKESFSPVGEHQAVAPLIGVGLSLSPYGLELALVPSG